MLSFIHSCDNVQPVVDTDILKPDTGYLTIIERPVASMSGSSRGTTEHHASGSSGSHSPTAESYAEPVSEGEEDEIMNTPARDEDKRTGLSGEDVKAAIAYREQMLKERRKSEATSNGHNIGKPSHKEDEGEDEDEDEDSIEEGEAPYPATTKPSNLKPRTLSIDPLAPSSAFDETLKTRLHGAKDARDRELRETDNAVDEEQEDENRADENRADENRADENRADENQDEDLGPHRIISRDWAAPAGKKIAVPVRIEPKVYFAAERTFLVRLLPWFFPICS
jgi:hypothetical protein